MELVQEILVYLTLLVALGYLVIKFLVPKKFLASKKSDKSCGHEDCGCH